MYINVFFWLNKDSVFTVFQRAFKEFMSSDFAFASCEIKAVSTDTVRQIQQTFNSSPGENELKSKMKTFSWTTFRVSKFTAELTQETVNFLLFVTEICSTNYPNTSRSC